MPVPPKCFQLWQHHSYFHLLWIPLKRSFLSKEIDIQCSYNSIPVVLANFTVPVGLRGLTRRRHFCSLVFQWRLILWLLERDPVFRIHLLIRFSLMWHLCWHCCSFNCNGLLAFENSWTIQYWHRMMVSHVCRNFRLKIAPNGRRWSMMDSSYWLKLNLCLMVPMHCVLDEISMSLWLT